MEVLSSMSLEEIISMLYNIFYHLLIGSTGRTTSFSVVNSLTPSSGLEEIRVSQRTMYTRAEKKRLPEVNKSNIRQRLGLQAHHLLDVFIKNAGNKLVNDT